MIKKLSFRKSKVKVPTRDEFFNFFNQLSHPGTNKQFDYSYEAEALAYLNSTSNFLPYTIYSNETDFINRNITTDEVITAIDYLKNNKSAGIDCIPSEFLKIAKEKFQRILLVCLITF